MPIENHSLANEFPEHKERIHDLKASDMHFLRLFNEYHDVDKDIHRFESGAQVTSDEHLETLKLERLHLKDKLLVMLVAQPA
ncbi:MAG: hypothetical protein ACI8SR_002388 [Oceanicoccus sp.]|jgi:uncharacterized protein YdcH (DUF465 family)